MLFRMTYLLSLFLWEEGSNVFPMVFLKLNFRFLVKPAFLILVTYFLVKNEYLTCLSRFISEKNLTLEK